jgi:hypothetical protein
MVKDSTNAPPDILEANNIADSPSQSVLSIAFAVIEGGSVIAMSIVAMVAHKPTSGVKILVKIPVVELSIVLGLQVPVNPSREVGGNTSTLPV